MPENWSENADPRVSTPPGVEVEWWKAFHDPTLDQLIQLAHEQNLPLQVAGLRILEARARLGIAVGRQFPQTQEIRGSASNVGLSRNAANSAQLDHFFQDYQIGFDAAWELDFWGKYRRGVESETAILIASEADYDDALVSLTAEVARTYTTIRTFEVLIELTQRNAKIQEEGLQLAESRFRNGITTELDVMQARTLLESTRASIPDFETGLRQSQNALSTLLGRPAGMVQHILEARRVIPEAQAEVAVTMPAELLRRRPDIRSAELIAMAQGARIGVAKADLYPSFSIFGDFGFQTSSGYNSPGRDPHFYNLFDGDSAFYSVGPAFQWPILNYGRITNNVRVQDARFQQLLVNYQNTVLRAIQEVEDALIAFLKAQDSQRSRQNSVAAARRSVEISLVQYREGAADFQRVLDAQRALLQEETTLAQTRSSVATNLIALYKALGGGWELREGQPIIAESAQREMRNRTNWGSLLPSPTPPENPTPPARDIPLLRRPVW